MKKLQNLGVILGKQEQKKITGGYGDCSIECHCEGGITIMLLCYQPCNAENGILICSSGAVNCSEACIRYGG